MTLSPRDTLCCSNCAFLLLVRRLVRELASIDVRFQVMGTMLLRSTQPFLEVDMRTTFHFFVAICYRMFCFVWDTTSFERYFVIFV